MTVFAFMKANLIFSFAALETTHSFPSSQGPPGFVAIQGKVYHRIRPTHRDSAIRWLLYDGFMGNTPHQHLADLIPPHWIHALRSALLRVNPFVHSLTELSAQIPRFPTASLILHDTGTNPEIAACISYNNTTSQQIRPRRLIVSVDDGYTQQIPSISGMWEPLSYPLLFPEGTPGWGIADTANTHPRIGADQYQHRVDAPMTQMWFYHAWLLREPRFQIFGRLANEYMVDMFSRDLECRLAYIRANQRRICQEEATLNGLDDAEASQNVYLPASFLGSARWASEQIADALET